MIDAERAYYSKFQVLWRRHWAAAPVARPTSGSSAHSLLSWAKRPYSIGKTKNFAQASS